MIRALCVVVTALALAVPGAGVALADEETPAPAPVTSTEAPAPPADAANNDAQPKTTGAESSEPSTPPTTTTTPAPEDPIVRGNCQAYSEAGVFDILRSDPRYRRSLDVDGDGVACERGGEGNPPRGLPRWHDRIEGRYLILDRGPRLDVCDSDSYDVFLARHGAYRDRIVHLIGSDGPRRFSDLHRACVTTDTTVVKRGDCTTTITRQTAVWADYRRAVDRWNELARRHRHDRTLAEVIRRELDRAHGDVLRLRRDYDRVRTERVTVCKDNGGEDAAKVVIEVKPTAYTAPAPATVTVTSAPSSSEDVVRRLPSGGINTGNSGLAQVA